MRELPILQRMQALELKTTNHMEPVFEYIGTGSFIFKQKGKP